MNPAIITLLAAVGVALCALLIVASGLIHTSLKRRKAVASGGPNMASRILDDLRPVKALLVDFVRHSPDMAALLSILSPLHSPASFSRLVHEIRIGRNGSTDPMIAANLVGPTLFILGLAGLIRIRAGGLVITEVGREVQRLIDHAPKPFDRTVKTVKQETQPAAARREGRDRLTQRTVAAKEANTMNTNSRDMIMTAADHAKLETVITLTGKVSARARAKIVEPEEIPSDVITMNSRAELIDLESEERMQFTLVLPRDAKIEEGEVSVFAPLGTAMLGYRFGDEFQWRVPYGVCRLKVNKVYFQLEAALKMAA
ncbi:MAG: GreA/GreB family elongation factor [Chthoniobacterales bacterium]